MTERSTNKIPGPAMGSESGGAVAYVSFEGKIMAMPGWRHSTVRSIVVTKADGDVEVMSRDCSTAGERANFLVEALDADVTPLLPHDLAAVAPSTSTSRPGASMLPRPKSGPERGGASGAARWVVWPGRPGSPGSPGASWSASGAEPPPPPVEPPPPDPEPPAGGRGGRRQKRLKVHACPPGLPYRVYEHHFSEMHRRGQDAALAGDFSGLLRHAAEGGCRECVLALLRLDPHSEEMLRNTGRSGWDAAGWAKWGFEQASKEGNDDLANRCSYLWGIMERMKREVLAAVLGELDYEPDEFSDDDEEDEEEDHDYERPPLRALPWR